MNLQDLCALIVRDAIPATDSGATCFVPRYQIDQLREALSAQQPAADGGFTAADMMDARQEGRREAQQPAAVDGAAREYLAARDAYDAATRPPNSHAPAPRLKHGDPIVLRLRAARVALDAALTAQQPAAVDEVDTQAAEIEALRAEVAKQSAYAKRTHDWNTELLANNERLAEALRVIEGFTMSQFRDAADMAGACVETAHNALHPTAAQEDGND